MADAAWSTRHRPGNRWFVDETYVKVNGRWRYVYRGIDQHGPVDAAPAERTKQQRRSGQNGR